MSAELEVVSDQDRQDREHGSTRLDPKIIAIQGARLLTERLLEDLDADPAGTLRKLEQASRLHRELLSVCDGATPMNKRGRRGRMSNPMMDSDMADDFEEGFATMNAMGIPMGAGTGDLTSSLIEQAVSVARTFTTEKQAAETGRARIQLRAARATAYQHLLQAATKAREIGDTDAAERYDTQAERLADLLDSDEGSVPVAVPDGPAGLSPEPLPTSASTVRIDDEPAQEA